MFNPRTCSQEDSPSDVQEMLVENFSLRHVPGDGACLFYAAALGLLLLYRDEETFQSHCDTLFGPATLDVSLIQHYLRELEASPGFLMGEATDIRETLKAFINDTWRKKIVDYMRKHFRNDTDFRGFFLGDPEDLEQALDNYFNDMEKPYAWGGEHEIRAIAQYLGHPIHVYSEDREGSKQKPIVYAGGRDTSDKSNPPICLLHGYIAGSKERVHYSLLARINGPQPAKLQRHRSPGIALNKASPFLQCERVRPKARGPSFTQPVLPIKQRKAPFGDKIAYLFDEAEPPAKDPMSPTLNNLEDFVTQAHALSTMGLVLSYYRGTFLNRCETLDFLSDGSHWLTLQGRPSPKDTDYADTYLCCYKPFSVNHRLFSIHKAIGPPGMDALKSRLKTLQQDASYLQIRLSQSKKHVRADLKEKNIVILKTQTDQQPSNGQPNPYRYQLYYEYRQSGDLPFLPVYHRTSLRLQIDEAFKKNREASHVKGARQAFLPLQSELYKIMALRRGIKLHYQPRKCSLVLPVYGEDNVSALAQLDLVITPEGVSIIQERSAVFYSRQEKSSNRDPVKLLRKCITNTLSELFKALSPFANNTSPIKLKHFYVTCDHYQGHPWFPHLFVVEKSLQAISQIIFGEHSEPHRCELVESPLTEDRVLYIENKHKGVLQRFAREYKTLNFFYAAYEKELDGLKTMTEHLLGTPTHPCFGKMAEPKKPVDESLNPPLASLPVTLNRLTQAIKDNSEERIVFDEQLCNLMSAIQRDKKDNSVSNWLSALQKGGLFYYHRLHELSIDNKDPYKRNLSPLNTNYTSFEERFFPSKRCKRSLPLLAIEKNTTITTLCIKNMDFNLPIVHPYRRLGRKGATNEAETDKKRVDFFESTAFSHRRCRNYFSRKYTYIKEIRRFITGFTYLRRLEFTNNVFKRTSFAGPTVDGFSLNKNTYKRATACFGKNTYFSDAIAECIHLDALVTDVCPSKQSLNDLYKKKKRYGLTGFNHLEIHSDMKEYWTEKGISLLGKLLAPNAIVVLDGQRGTALTEEWVKPLLIMLQSKEVVALTLDNHPAFLKKANGDRGDGYGLRFLAMQLAQGWHLNCLSLRNNALTNEAIHCLSTFLPHNASLLTLSLDNTGDICRWDEEATMVLLAACERHPYLSRLNLRSRFTKNDTRMIASAVALMEKSNALAAQGKRGGPLFVDLGETQDTTHAKPESVWLGGCDFSEHAATRALIGQYVELKNHFMAQDPSETKSKALEVELKIYRNMLLDLSTGSEEASIQKIDYNRLWRLAIYSGLAALTVAGFAASAIVSSLHTFGVGGLAHALSGMLVAGSGISLTARAVFDLIQRLSHKLLTHSLYQVLQECLQLFWDHLQKSHSIHQPLSKEEQEELQRRSRYVQEEIKEAYQAEEAVLGREKAVDEWYRQILPDIVHGYPQRAACAPQDHKVSLPKEESPADAICQLLKEGDYTALKCLLGEALYRRVGGGNIHLFEYEGAPRWLFSDEDDAYRTRKRAQWEKEKFEQLKTPWGKNQRPDLKDVDRWTADPHAALVAWWREDKQAIDTLLKAVEGICNSIIGYENPLNEEKAHSRAVSPLDDLFYYHQAVPQRRAGRLTTDPWRWEEQAQCFFYFLMVSGCVFRTAQDRKKLEDTLDVFLYKLAQLEITEGGSSEHIVQPFSEPALKQYSGLRCFLGDLLATLASMGRLFEQEKAEEVQSNLHETAKTTPSPDTRKGNNPRSGSFAAHKKAFFKNVIRSVIQTPLEMYFKHVSLGAEIPISSSSSQAGSLEDRKLYLKQEGSELLYGFKTPLGQLCTGQLALNNHQTLFLSQYGLDKLKQIVVPQLSRHLRWGKNEVRYDRRTNRSQLFLYLEAFCLERSEQEVWLAMAVKLEQIRDNLDEAKRSFPQNLKRYLRRRLKGEVWEISNTFFLAAHALIKEEIPDPSTKNNDPPAGSGVEKEGSSPHG